MRSLASIQREFMAAVFGEGPVAPRIDVYRRNAMANLHGALAATYPVVERLVGVAFFREAARQFALATSSMSGDLHDYGGSFGEFLRDYPHATALSYLPDVARLEWACHECYHAADGPAFDFATLAEVLPERYDELRFRLGP